MTMTVFYDYAFFNFRCKNYYNMGENKKYLKAFLGTVCR
jgi:hypothetical protein